MSGAVDAGQAAAPLWMSGGTGLVGRRLRRALARAGRSLRIVSRRPELLPKEAGTELFPWDGLHPPQASLAGCAAVIHLSGEPLFAGLPGERHRQRVWASRVESTRALVDVLDRLDPRERPRTLLCASAVGYFGDRGEERLDEDAPRGEGFLAELCEAWEQQAARCEELGMRRVSLRFGVVLAREGGVLARVAPIFRLGLGGRLGSGRQWFPWVHIDDAVALVLRALLDESLRGPLHLVSPEPVRNLGFTAALGRVLHRPTLLRVPAFAVRAALGPLADELLGSKRVFSSRFQGVRFLHSPIESALRAELAPQPRGGGPG